MLKLYNATPSGNCYKVRLVLAHLGVPYETVEIDVTSTEPRPAELLEHNPLGKVPVVVFDDGRGMAESNSILWHFGRGTPYLPDDEDDRTEILRWLFFEQNIHEPTIAVNRFLISYVDRAERFADVIAFNHRRGEGALDTMERHLSEHEFFVGDRYSIADIALYAYTHVADEGGFELRSRPTIQRWFERVRAQPGHVTMSGDAP
jgi:glutathione S-transferase